METEVKKMQDLGLVYKSPDEKKIHATFIASDGQVVDPLERKQKMTSEFTAFIKARHQDPLGATGTHKGIVDELS